MAKVVLKNVTKIFPGNVPAVVGADLEVADKEFVVLVGPSGCGKSTTLRVVAGLEELTGGDIYIGGRHVNDVLPKDRDIAMVFQNYALYPHMNVFENMSFGLRLRRYPKNEIVSRVEEAAGMLGIKELLHRKPRELSGGQRQRVAVGRAIVRKPKVFLFDEPLSNLDAKFRVLMRTEIIKLHTKLQATMIYVTHDQVEAMTMGNRIVVMKDALIQQVSDPIVLYDQPVNRFVAGFIGTPPMNFLDGKIIKRDGALYFDEGSFRVRIVNDMVGALAPYLGKEVIFGIRSENIHNKLFVVEASPENTITATVEVVEPMGSEIYIHLATPRHTFVARVGSHDKPELNQELDLILDMATVHFFDKATDKTIV